MLIYHVFTFAFYTGTLRKFTIVFNFALAALHRRRLCINNAKAIRVKTRHQPKQKKRGGERERSYFSSYPS